MTMNLTIRRARPSDRRWYDWQLYHTLDGSFKPWVVTVDGRVYLVIQGDTVVFQNGSPAVPDLLRMARRWQAAVPALHDDKAAR